MFKKPGISALEIQHEIEVLVNGSRKTLNLYLMMMDPMYANLPKLVFGPDDKYKITIQASLNHYCTPRQNGGPYTSVELGYPNFNFSSDFISQYAEDANEPQETVYGYVPISELAEEIYNLLKGL